MARLAELITGFASVLQIPAGTVKNTAAVLRAAGLLTSGPRGPGAPHMTPTDATNLLLALMYDDLQENAALNVPRLRLARLRHTAGRIGYDYGGGLVLEAPRHEFVRDDNDGTRSLGGALDALFDLMVRFGTVDFELDADEPLPKELIYVGNFSLDVSRPGYFAAMHLDAHAVLWSLTYRFVEPAAEALGASPDASKAAGAPPRNDLADLGPFMGRTRTIRDEELHALANVLRGTPFNENAIGEEISPPYGAWSPTS